MTFVTILTICAIFFLLRCAVPTRARMGAGVCEQKRGVPSDSHDLIRVATYNIHGAKGADGRRDLARIAAEIDRADLVAVQEVRAAWGANQARELADLLSMGWLYTPTLRRWCQNYRGNALLSRFPIFEWQTYPLPNIAGHRYRIYTVAKVEVGDAVLSVLYTHLHTGLGREQQLKIVLEQFADLPDPAVLVGDLNTRPGDPALGSYQEIESASTGRPDQVDWIFTRGLEVIDRGFTDSGASDHPYYWVDVRIGESDPAGRQP